jgi:ABC-type lipoprotein export system ATPase subunit
MGGGHIDALRQVDLDVWPNEYLAIMGQSGSGKSTLMNIIGCLDRPTAGYQCNAKNLHQSRCVTVLRTVSKLNQRVGVGKNENTG